VLKQTAVKEEEVAQCVLLEKRQKRKLPGFIAPL
jgi:hypothetical protein